MVITKLQLASIGNTFRVKVKAYNPAGEIESPILGVILASLPLQPPAPVFVAELSWHSQITIDISDFPTESAGGCPVVSFEVQKDDGNGGTFVAIAGDSKSTPFLMPQLATTNVVKGRVYRFRYRAQNCHGWGPLSPILYSLAASVPRAPPSLKITSVSASTLSL